jgi:hypothetical protein
MQASITPEEYAKHRDMLACLLEEAATLPKLLPESANRIAQARTKLLENEFVFTLVGEFQGGKSTTFNLLAGNGRELSPRGKNFGGIKTSGCILRAIPLSDPEEPEHALVRWRTPEEILMGFSDLLREPPSEMAAHSTDDSPKKLSIDQIRENLLDTFNPETTEGCARIRERAIEFREKAKNSIFGTYIGIDPEIIDQIRYALIAAHFYKTPEIQEQLNKSRITLAEVRKLIVFPEDWEERWTQNKPDAFQASEVCFAFVKEICLRIHSPELKTLGCSIVDCPGLGVSAWDTLVAQEAISNADAVLYLVSGDKTLNLNDFTQLSKLTSAGSRVFLAPNNKNLPWKQAEKVAKATLSILQNNGNPFSEERFQPFSALLALHGKQLERLLPWLPGETPGLDPDTIAALDADVRNPDNDDPQPFPLSTIARRIRRRAEKLSEIYRGNEYTEAPDDAQLVKICHEMSRFPMLLEKVQNFVLSNRALGILRNNAEKAEEALKETEGNLQAEEDAAKQKKEECEAQFIEAESILSDFEKQAREDLSRFGNKDDVRALTQSLRNFIVNGQHECISVLVEKVKRKLKAIDILEHLISIFDDRKKKEISEEILSECKKAFEDWLKERVRLWVVEVREGREIIYNTTVNRHLEILLRDMERYWTQAVAKHDLPLLRNIVLKTTRTFDAFGTVSIQQLESEVLQAVDDQFEATIWVAGIMIGGLVLALVIALTAVTWPALALLIPIIAIAFPNWKVYLDKDHNQLRADLGRKFPELAEAISENAATAIERHLQSIVDHVTQEVINHPRRIFEQRKAEAQAAFNLAESKRQQLAEEARQLRETKFVPLRHRISEFKAALDAQFNTDRS